MASVHTAHATYNLDVSLVSQNRAGNYSTLSVHVYAVADAGWSGSASGIGFSATGYGNGTFGFSGTRAEVVTYTFNVGHDAAGNLTGYAVSAHTNDTGTSTYGGPVDISQAVIVPRIPKVPSVPAAITATAQPGLKVAVTITGSADNGGSAVTAYTVQYSADGGATWTGNQNINSGSYTYAGLAPGNYIFRVWATNAIGNSGYRVSGTVTVLAGGYVWNGTSWVASLGVYVWNGTGWVLCQGVYVWNGTSWAAAL
ncbi:fibronectin type III domain-containing protein [Leifsonia poae]|uniref:fibronectin type III domain-containing protein n=1 Tax=Leifsonia poae TaxID=110933 RepID=UPI001CBB6B6E|nr:fibronectin type III domain-containing protein [Leifsonia poae]